MNLSPDWPNNTSKLVKAKWKFREMRRYCMYETGTGPEGKATDVYKWVPYEFSSGYTKGVANNPTFTCATEGPVNSKVTFSTTATVKWGGWFEIAGVKLSNTQTQSSGTSLTVDPDTGKTPRYCGSNSSGLRYSGFVREISS